MMENTQFKIFLGLELDKKAGTTLNQEIKKLSENGINLKVGLDENSLKQLTSAINGVTQQLQKMSSIGGKSFDTSTKKVQTYAEGLKQLTEQYRQGTLSAKEYNNEMMKRMTSSKTGELNKFNSQLSTEELQGYLSILNEIQNRIGKIQPIGDLISTKDTSTVVNGFTEIVKRVETYSDKMGKTQTITSLVNKETGGLIASYETLSDKSEKYSTSIEKQKTSMEKLKASVGDITKYNIDMIKSGSATQQDNAMISQANQIKKEYQEINSLSEQGKLIDGARLEAFKRMVYEQETLIKKKDTELTKDKQLEESLFQRDRLVKQLQASLNKESSQYSTGVNDADKQAMQDLINSYAQLDPAQENMKRKTTEIKDAMSQYSSKIKEVATAEQKQQVATEKHALAVQKLQNAFKNTNNKYSVGVDASKSTMMQDQIRAFQQLDPLTENYAQDLQKIALAMAQYTVETRESTLAINNQYSNIAKLKTLQESLNSTLSSTKGYHDEDKANSLQQTLNQMTQMIASGQDVSNILKVLGADIKKFGKDSTSAMQSSAKTLKEEQQLYAYKEKMLVNLNLLEQKFSSKGMDTKKIQEARTQVQSLTVGTDNLKGKIVELDVAYKQLSGDYQMKKMATSMKSMLGMATGFYGLYSVFGYLRQGMSSIVSETTKLDDAMLGLHRVTDETSASYEAFRKSAFETANEIGGSAKEIIDSASEFAKLGYEFSEATKLAESATKYATVGEIDLAESTDALSASYTVFGETFDKVMGKMVDSTTIIDLYNKIGNTMAVTSGDIGEAMKASANSLELANNSLSESVALIATANKTVQDSSKVGNALRTISMRLRGVKDDAGELVPKMRELIQTATNGKVDIMDGDDFKSTYQIMLEISEVWDELSDKQQAYLAEAVAGKNRAEVFTAIMGNSEDLTYAMEMAKDSIGSVDEEMAVVMQTFEKRVKAMQNAWASLATTTLTSDFVKGFIDATTAVIQLVDACGGLVPVLTTAIGLLIIFKNESATLMALNIAKAFKGWGTSIGAFSLYLKDAVVAMKLAKAGGATFSGVLSAGKTALVGVASATSVATLGIGALVTAVSLGVMAYSNWNKSVKEAQQKQLENAKASKEQTLSIENLAKEYKSASAIIDDSTRKQELLKIQDRLVDTFGEEAKGINLVNGEYKEQLALLEQLKEKKISDSTRALDKEYNDKKNKVDKVVEDDSFILRTGTLNPFSDYSAEYKKAVEDINKTFGKELASIDLNGWLHFDVDNAEEYRDAIDALLMSLQQQGVYEGLRYNELTKHYDKLTEAIEGYEGASKDYFENLYAKDSVNIAEKLGIKDLSKMTQEEAKAFADALQLFLESPSTDNEYAHYLQKLVVAMKEAQEEAKNTAEAFGDGTEEPLSSLSVVAEQVANDMDILKVSLGELDATNDISEETMKKLISKYPELAEKIKGVDSAYQALNQKIAENNFSEASEGIADLVTVLEDLEAGNGITASSFKKISDGFPELLAYMDDEASLADAITNKMNYLKTAQKKAYDEMLMNSQEYYRVNVLNNDKMVQSISSGIDHLFRNLATAYDGDMKNWESLARGKADVEEKLISAINDAWEGHFSVLMLKFNKMAGITIATPQFDRDAYAEQLKKDNFKYNSPLYKDMLEQHLDMAEQKFNSEIADYQEYQKTLAQAKQEVADLFDIKFKDPNIQFSGSTSSPSGSSGSSSNPTTSYVASIYEAIVDEILRGGEEIEKAMDETNTKLDNAILIGDTALEEQLKAKLANLQVSLRDKQASMAKELEAQMAEMAQILSKSGAFKGYDISKLTEKDLAQVNQNIEKQINSATLAENDDEIKRLNDIKSLINDVGSVYLDTIEKRRELSDRWWQEENARMETFAENLEEQYQKLFDAVDREDKVLELRKSMLLEDGGEYDKEQKDADKILDINAQMLKNLLKKRTLCESQIAQLRAKGFKEESKEIQDLQDKWLDYEQARIDMIKEVAEARRQNAIDSAQNESDDISTSKDYIKDLLSLTIDMIKEETEAKKEALKQQVDARKEALKKEYDAEKKALEDRLSLLQKEANARKDALSEEKAEKDYQEEVSEKQKEISNVQQKLDALDGDDSITSQKLKKELKEQLDDLIKELEKIQYERSIELQQQAIDKELEMQEEKIEAELEKLEDQYEEEVEMIEDKYDAQLKEYEDYLKNQQKLKEDASKLIESRDKEFYERLKKYAMEYTDTTQAEFEDCWNKAYEALDKYGDKQLGVIGIIEQMTQKVIALNAELKKLNDSTYKDFIQDDSTTSSDDFEFAGDKNNSSSSDKKVDEERDEIARKMNENSQKWFTASDEEKKRLAQENEKLAKEIGAWKATSDGDGWKKGEWVVSIGKKVYAVKNAVGVRHTGLDTGEVGAPFGKFKIKSNEELNKLENGEIVINGEQSNNIMKNVKKLSEGVQSGGVSLTIDMHDFSVAKDTFEEFKKLMKVEVPKIINQRLVSKGIK